PRSSADTSMTHSHSQELAPVATTNDPAFSHNDVLTHTHHQSAYINISSGAWISTQPKLINQHDFFHALPCPT
uniref:Uncharacterized protein n=1 Tax=Aegilops tauschii subsp. strangulata TaxID=200361 RepID=A0A453EE70_AEGTS